MQVDHSSGIVCANFGYTRGGWTPCLGAWHGQCFATLPADRYPSALRPRLMEQLHDGEVPEEEAPGLDLVGEESDP